MQISAAVCLTLILAQPAGLFAEQPALEFARSVPRDIGSHLSTRQQSPAPKRSWIIRHPVIFGALSGAAAGALIGGTVGHPCVEESFCRRPGLMQLGAAAGAGVGALAGLVVSWIR